MSGFRLRARLAIRGRLGSPKLGLFELGTHHVVHIPSCRVQHPLINQVAAIVRGALVDARISCYSDKAQLGLARYLQVVIERRSQPAQVVLVGHCPTAAPLAVRRATGDYPAAAQAQEQALGIYRDLGNRLGQATALSGLGDIRRMTGDFQAAAQALEQALGICRDLGDRNGQANTLAFLGAVRRMMGDFQAAAQALDQALGICRDLGDRGGEAETLNERGTLHRVSGDLAQAEGCHQQALDLAGALASSWDEAHALAGLGRCALAAGHATQAEILLRQALEIFHRIGAAEAPDLLAELDALTGPPPAR